MSRHGQNIYRASVFIGVHQNMPMSLYKPRAYIRDFAASGNRKSSHEISNQKILYASRRRAGGYVENGLARTGWMAGQKRGDFGCTYFLGDS